MGPKKLNENIYVDRMQEVLIKENIVRVIKSMRTGPYENIYRRKMTSAIRNITDWNPGYNKSKEGLKRKLREEVDNNTTKINIEQ